MERVIIPVIGLFAMLAVCYVLSNNRSKIDWKLVGWGLALQFVFALLILKTDSGKAFFSGFNNVIQKVLQASNEGTKFVFGSWGDMANDNGHSGENSVQKRFDNFYKANFQMTTLNGVRFFIAGSPKDPITVPILDEREKVTSTKTISNRQDLIVYLQKNGSTVQDAIEASTHLVILLEGIKKDLGQDPEALAKKFDVPAIDQAKFQSLLGGVGQKGFYGSNFVFFPQILGTIILVSTLMSILFYFGIMQKLVQAVAWVMMKTMGSSGAESLAAAANIFVGQTEAPLVIGPYLKTMTKAELLSLMVGGMATIAGGVLVAYTFLGVSAGHLLAASVMSAPAAILCAKILYPETGEPVTRGKVKLDVTIPDQNVIEAAARGCSDGLKLALNVMAMLIGFIACVEVMNILLGNITLPSGAPLNFQQIMAWIFYPFAWLMGISSKDLNAVAQLLGVKTVLNEFIAYLDMSRMKETMDPRNFVITTYALCGFANFSSIGIQIGGISALAEERRSELASLGMRALIGGTIASYMTACIAAILIDPGEEFYKRAQERIASKNWIGAVEDCNQAIALNPSYIEAYYARATVRKEEGNFTEAIVDYNKILEINADYIDAYNSRGYVRAKSGNLKEAIADFSEALKRQPQNDESLYNRGIAHFNFGNKEDARKDCTEYLEVTKKKKGDETKKRRKAIVELFPELETKRASSELDE